MITVYSMDECAACHYTKKFLAEHGIVYTEIDVTKDVAMQNQLRDKGFTEMPAVVTDYGRWSGYKRERLKALVIPHAE